MIVTYCILAFIVGWVAGIITALEIGRRARRRQHGNVRAIDVAGLAASIVQELDQLDRDARLSTKEARRG